MEISYKREAEHRLMILTDADIENSGNSYKMQMLTKNRIAGLVPCALRRIDRETAVCYRIDDRQPLFKYLERNAIDAAFFKDLAAQLLKTLSEMEEYFLDINDIFLSVKTVFKDEKTSEFSFTVLPGISTLDPDRARRFAGDLMLNLSSLEDDLKIAFEFFRLCAQDELTAEKLAALAYQNRPVERAKTVFLDGSEIEAELPKEPLFNLTAEKPDKKERRSLLQKVWGGRQKKKRERRQEEMDEDAYWKNINQSFVYDADREQTKTRRPERGEDIASPHIDREKKMGKQISSYHEKRGSKRRDENRSEASETVFLGGEKVEIPTRIYARLIPTDVFEGEDICLCKDMVVIGNEKSKTADAKVPSGGVSRKHARLFRVSDTYSLSDLDSRNGTFCNGKRVAPGEELLLTDGDEVVFADVGYTFHLN